MRITLENYVKSYDHLYPDEYNVGVRTCAEMTVKKVNSVLAVLEAEGVRLEANPKTGSIVSSGWRPQAVNSNVKGAAIRSKHITGQACDLYDPEGDIDTYLSSDAGLRVLTSAGLWLEHPAATKGWSHLQTVPPRSGNRIFYP
jgi:hypothetical protein